MKTIFFHFCYLAKFLVLNEINDFKQHMNTLKTKRINRKQI